MLYVTYHLGRDLREEGDNKDRWEVKDVSPVQSKIKTVLNVKVKFGLLSPLYHLTLGPTPLRVLVRCKRGLCSPNLTICVAIKTFFIQIVL